MVDGSFFCATLTGRGGGHSPFVQAGAETPDTGAEVLQPVPGPSWESHSVRVCTGVGNENAESCGVVRPLRIPLVIRPVRRTYESTVQCFHLSLNIIIILQLCIHPHTKVFHLVKKLYTYAI